MNRLRLEFDETKRERPPMKQNSFSSSQEQNQLLIALDAGQFPEESTE